ncbi:hypothetical protein HDU96_004400 [Phlyctochytrium bullatum]|nr:hypothetical protein HDU96_004400 [Phlyctochytrium bullatum]
MLDADGEPRCEGRRLQDHRWIPPGWKHRALMAVTALCIVHPATCQPTIDIPIGVLLPLNNPYFNVSMRRALDLTLTDLNTDPSYRLSFPNGTLARYRLRYADSRGSMSGAVEGAMELARGSGADAPPVVGIVGEFSSGRSAPVALAMGSFGVWQCGTATNPDLSDKTQYPYFFRTIPSDKAQAQALVSYVQRFGWKQVGLITVNTGYGFGISYNFLKLATAVNITVLRNEAYNPDDTNFRLQMQSLHQADARVIIAVAYDADMVRMLREARKWGLVSNAHVWIGSEAVEPVHDLVYGETASQYTDADRSNIAGLQLCAAYERGGAVYEAFNARYLALYAEQPKTYSWTFRDCLLAMHYGFARLAERGVEAAEVVGRRTGVGVGEFLEGGFEGATGWVRFDENGDRINGYVFKNVVNGVLVETLLVTPNQTFVPFRDVVFYGGSTVPPPDGLVPDRQLLELFGAFGLTTIVAVGVMVTVSLASVAGLVVLRNEPAVRRAGMGLYATMGVGLALQYFGVFGHLGRYEVNLACGVQEWVGWIGHSVFMQGAISKAWLVFRTFDSDKDKIVQVLPYLKDHNLLLLSTPLTLLNFLIISLSATLDPLRPVLASRHPTEFHYECRSRSYAFEMGIYGLLLAYNGTLVLSCLVLCALGWFSSSVFRESVFILYACVNVCLCNAIRLGIEVSGSGSFVTTVTLRVLLTYFGTTIGYALTVGRIVLLALRYRNGDMKAEAAKSSRNILNECSSLLDPSKLGEDGGPSYLSIMVPVKDGTRRLARWVNRKVMYSVSHGTLLFIHPRVGNGDVLQTDHPSFKVAKSETFPESVEVRCSDRFFVLQMPSAADVDSFLALFRPGKSRSLGEIRHRSLSRRRSTRKEEATGSVSGTREVEFLSYLAVRRTSAAAT